MEQAAAQTAVVEIAFAVNTLSAVWDGILQLISNGVKDGVDNYTGQVQTTESADGPVDKQKEVRINFIAKWLQGLGDQHVRFQTASMPWVTGASSVFAISSIYILYGASVDAAWFTSSGTVSQFVTSYIFTDWSRVLGPWIILLMLPLPLYCLVSLFNWIAFRVRGWFFLRQHDQFLALNRQFTPPPEPPPQPPEIGS